MSGKCRWLGRCSQRDGPDGSSRGVAPLSRCQSRPSTDGRLQELFSSRGAIIQSKSHLFSSDGFTIDDSFIVLGFCVSIAVCIIMDSHHECFNCPCSACPGASCLELSTHVHLDVPPEVQYVLGTVLISAIGPRVHNTQVTSRIHQNLQVSSATMLDGMLAQRLDFKMQILHVCSTLHSIERASSTCRHTSESSRACTILR